MAERANRLHMQMMLWLIAKIMVVFVAAIAAAMPAVSARQSTWMRQFASPDGVCDRMPGLLVYRVPLTTRPRPAGL
jgi:hypothetical protein